MRIQTQQLRIDLFFCYMCFLHISTPNMGFLIFSLYSPKFWLFCVLVNQDLIFIFVGLWFFFYLYISQFIYVFVPGKIEIYRYTVDFIFFKFRLEPGLLNSIHFGILVADLELTRWYSNKLVSFYGSLYDFYLVVWAFFEYDFCYCKKTVFYRVNFTQIFYQTTFGPALSFKAHFVMSSPIFSWAVWIFCFFDFSKITQWGFYIGHNSVYYQQIGFCILLTNWFLKRF